MFSAPYLGNERHELHSLFHEWHLDKPCDIWKVYFFIRNIDHWTVGTFQEYVVGGINNLLDVWYWRRSGMYCGKEPAIPTEVGKGKGDRYSCSYMYVPGLSCTYYNDFALLVCKVVLTLLYHCNYWAERTVPCEGCLLEGEGSKVFHHECPRETTTQIRFSGRFLRMQCLHCPGLRWRRWGYTWLTIDSFSSLESVINSPGSIFIWVSVHIAGHRDYAVLADLEKIEKGRSVGTVIVPLAWRPFLLTSVHTCLQLLSFFHPPTAPSGCLIAWFLSTSHLTFPAWTR